MIPIPIKLVRWAPVLFAVVGVTFIIFFTFRSLHQSPNNDPTSIPTPIPSYAPSPTVSSFFCGGIAGIACPDGYECQLDGNYPDAGGSCISLSVPTNNPTPTAIKDVDYVCPSTQWVDCMPGPGPVKKNCDSNYLQWATENCPGFQGAAY